MLSINLVKSIADPIIRRKVALTMWGIVPRDGKQRTVTSILANSDKYSKLAAEIEKNDSIKRGFKPQN